MQLGSFGFVYGCAMDAAHIYFVITHGLPVLGIVALALLGSKPTLAVSRAVWLPLCLLLACGGAYFYRGSPRAQRPQAPPLPAVAYSFKNLTLPSLAPPYALDFACTADGTPSGARTTCAPAFCSAVSATTTAPCAASDTSAADMPAYLAEQAVRRARCSGRRALLAPL